MRALLGWLSELSTYAAIVSSSGHVHRRVVGFSLFSDRIAGKFSSLMVNLREFLSGMLGAPALLHGHVPDFPAFF
jgi:hypothetical protein